MFYVYILKTEYNNELYVGCTKDLKHRIEEHNSRKVISTKSKIPYTLIHYEAFLNKHDTSRTRTVSKDWLGQKIYQKEFKTFLS